MTEETKKVSAPYASWSSLLNFINKLRETNVPSRIDPSVFGNASGAISYSVIAALKYLKLIAENGVPSQHFHKIVAASDEERRSMFKALLQERYPTLYAGSIDLKTVTACQFDEHIRDQFEVRGSTVDKVAAFFIAAATFAEEPLSPHLKARRSVAASQSSKKSAKQRKPDVDGGQAEDPALPPPVTHQKPLEYQLIDLMSEPDIENDVKSSIWSLVQYLTQRKQKAGDQTK